MNRNPSPLRLGTRGSPLALCQARMVATALCEAHGWPETTVEIVVVRTTGDAVQDRALAEIGGKALWTRELDSALLTGKIDFAVHSMKDVEAIRPKRIGIAAMMPRADVRERLIGASSLVALPLGARVGTSSPRRAAQLRHVRPDLTIAPIRGNVATRLQKVESREVDATLLATAGLDRLGYHDVGTRLPLDTMLPAPQQAAIGVEAERGRADLWRLLAAIDHPPTHRCVAVERRFLRQLGGSCHSPVAGIAYIEDDEVRLDVELFTMDGRDRRRSAITIGPAADEEADIRALVAGLLADASPELQRLFQGGSSSRVGEKSARR